MKNVRKVLVTLALSEYSQGAYEFAADFAQCTGAELIVANIINERDVESVRTISAMGYAVDGEHYIANVKAERARMLEEIMSASDRPRDRTRTVLTMGNPMDEILKLIVAESVDVVVMGPKGRTDLEHVLVGSVADKIFRRSPATVISYRGGKLAERYKHRIEKHL